jgi:H+/Cl- antiporter ClcA
MKILSNLKSKEKFIRGFIIGVISAFISFIAVKIIHKTYGYDFESKPLFFSLIWLIIYFSIFKLLFDSKNEKTN